MWVLPTRGRPDRCQVTLDSIIAARTTTPGIVIVDDDPDPRYRALRLPTDWMICHSSGRRGYLGTLNYAFEMLTHHPWYGVLNDDLVIMTPGWDHKLIAAAGSRNQASSDDGWQGGRRMAGALVFGGDLLRAWGWWAPPGLWHWYSDDVWEHLGRALGNWVYVGDVKVEHRHVGNGKAADDATYQEGRSRADVDRAVFDALKYRHLPAAVARARSLFVDWPRPDANATGLQRLDRARSRKVMLCIPSARAPALEFTIAYGQTCAHLLESGIKATSQFVIGSSNLPRARNELVARFLASDCTDMIFIDDDMGWQPEAIVRLLASDKPMIAGVGRKRVDKPNSDPAVWCVHLEAAAGDRIVQDAMGAVEVLAVGTAFMKIERSVFETLIARHPEWKRSGHDGMSEAVKAGYYQFFRFDPDDSAEMGEDFVFCRRWREAGGTVWIDPAIWLAHVGTKNYAGCISELMVEAPDHLPIAEAAE